MSISWMLQVDLTDSFLFRSTTKSGHIVNLPMSSEAISSRLKAYLNELGMNEGETAHSFRSACAITLALTRSQLADVMDHMGWEREHTAHYYMKLAKVLRHDSTSSCLAEAVDGHRSASELALLYKDLNSLKEFAMAFHALESRKRRATSNYQSA